MNLSIKMANHPAGHHGFDIQDYDSRSREIIQATFALSARKTDRRY